MEDKNIWLKRRIWPALAAITLVVDNMDKLWAAQPLPPNKLHRSNSSPLLFGQDSPRDDLDWTSLGGGRDVESYVRQEQKMLLCVRILANRLGFVEYNGYKVVDLSYPSLCRYVGRLEQTRAFDKHTRVLQRIRAIQQPTFGGDMLLRSLLGDYFDDTALRRGEKIRFSNLLRDMISTPTGKQRAKTLLILQQLINTGIGDIGNQYYKDKKLKVTGGDNIAYTSSHKLEIKFVPYKEMTFGQNQSQGVLLSQGDMSALLLHELTHAAHFAMGINGAGIGLFFNNDIVKPLRAAYLPDQFLRERLIPFLHRGFFSAILKEIRDSSPALLHAMSSCKSIPDVYLPLYNFIQDNRFFRNPELEFPSVDDLSTPEGIVRSNLIYITCRFLAGWDNMEDMITIIGFLPLYFGQGRRYLLIDRQNESTQLARKSGRIRMTHFDLSPVWNVFGKESEKFLQLMSSKITEFGLQIYNTRDNMPVTPMAVYGENTVSYGDPLSATEIGEGILDYIRALPYRIGGRNGVDYATIASFSSIAKGYRYQLDKSVGLACAEAGALPEALMDCILGRDIPNREEVFMELLENANIGAVLDAMDYAEQHLPQIYQNARFIDWVKGKFAEDCTRWSGSQRVGYWQFLRKTLVQDGIVIPPLSFLDGDGNIDRVLKDLTTDYGYNNEMIGAVLMYYERHNMIPQNIFAVLKEAKNGIVAICEYIKRMELRIAAERTSTFSADLVEEVKNSQKYYTKRAIEKIRNMCSPDELTEFLQTCKSVGITCDITPLVTNSIFAGQDNQYLLRALLEFFEPSVDLIKTWRTPPQTSKCYNALLEYSLSHNLQLFDQGQVLEDLNNVFQILNSDSKDGKVHSNAHATSCVLLKYANKFQMDIPDPKLIAASLLKEKGWSDNDSLEQLFLYLDRKNIQMDLSQLIVQRIDRLDSDSPIEVASILALLGGNISADLRQCVAAAVGRDLPATLETLINFSQIDGSPVLVSSLLPEFIEGKKYACISHFLEFFSEDPPTNILGDVVTLLDRQYFYAAPESVNKVITYAHEKKLSLPREQVQQYFNWLNKNCQWDHEKRDKCAKYAKEILNLSLDAGSS
ncbi:MAG: hypothetical protein LBG20_00360 [Holosporaceae bacterium]|jgi:hypothetical protein|nr:hypothetical protein [Holosporaceae bacterium]